MSRTLIGFIKKELVQTLRDPRMRILLFVMPVIQLTLFGVALSNEVKNIRLAAVFDSKDTVLRDIYERSIAGKWFVPARSKEQDPYTMIEADNADAVLVPPPGGFTRALGRGDANLQLLVNATNVIEAQSIEAYLQNIVQQTVMDDLKFTRPAPPIQVSTRVLFNPALETSIFLVPGVMCMLMLISTMVLSNVSIVREKEMGTFEMLISAPVSRSEVIYGKTIPYVLLGMSNVPLILGVAVFAFHVPMRGSLIALFIAAFAFVCTAVAFGTLVSTFCKNQQQATLAGLLFNFPMIMLSGIMFPLENMPDSIRWLSFFDPLAHYMGLLRNIMLKGGEIDYVVTHIVYLAIIAVVSVIASFRRFHTTLE
ncbi:MAG TPA: ABC transporter permease [Nitrospirota bacterium]|nr:ABC transporter permease [Nitrospirota bacterium]